MTKKSDSNFGVTFVSNNGERVNVGDIKSKLERKLEKTTLVAWVAIGVAVALVVPISLTQIGLLEIKEQTEILKEQNQEIKEQNQEIKEQNKEIKRQGEEIIRLSVEVKNLQQK